MSESLARRLKPVHLRLVLRIAETGKLQIAADDVAMSQPAASRMLTEIERMAGEKLFQRHAKGMTATPVGLAFCRHARQILQSFDDLDTEVQEIASGRAGQVRVGSVTGPAAGCLVPAIRAVKHTAPDVEFTVEVAPSTRLVRGLDEGIFDFIIARLPPEANSRNYSIYPARNEVIMLMVRRDHPMIGRGAVRLEDLKNYEWVIQERGSPIRAAVERAFHACRLRMPEQVTNTSSLLVALALLDGSDAISPQSREVLELLSSSGLDLRVAPLDLDNDIQVPPFFVIVSANRQLSPVAEDVIAEVLRRL